jgi:phage gp46-like protein
MADIALKITPAGTMDLALAGMDLARDDGLESAVLVSLFTDRRARAEQLRPEDDKSDLRGWWGDFNPAVEGDRTGSLLWLLAREKQTAETLARAKQYCEQALAWMVEDRVASRVNVAVSYPTRGWMGIAVEIVRPDARRVQYRFDYEWAAQAAKRAA